MSSSDTQNQANALNVRMQGEAGKVLDEIERNMIRKVARESFACATSARYIQITKLNNVEGQFLCLAELEVWGLEKKVDT